MKSSHKILVCGKGYMGSRISRELGTDISDRRINSLNDALDELSLKKPDILINCIGHFGKNVDECEIDKDKTLQANTFVPLMLAEAALRSGVRFVHLGSGCIFEYDYEKNIPVTEEITPGFFGLFYSRCKIYSELALEALSRKYPFLITRIRIPLDNQPHPRNLLTKLISYRKVIDVPNTVTYIPDFIEALKHLITVEARGIYNVANKSGLRYQELMEAYRQYVPDFTYEVIDFKNLGLVRTNVILSMEKLEKSGFKVRDIHDVLEECVKQYLGKDTLAL